jgi:prepilin-type N-terminal cleavage/methylation domain-containing protein
MRLSHYHYKKGFTLIEMTITIAIVAVLGIVISKFQADVFSFNRYFQNSFDTAEKAQKLLHPMTAEIRSASQSNTGAYPVDAISDTDFSFYSDINNDGLKERVRYYLVGTTLYKEIIVPTGTPYQYNVANKVVTTFLTGVTNIADGVPLFTYYDATYIGSSGGQVAPSSGSINTVRLIGITIRIDPDPNKPPASVQIQTMVAIRNLKQQ